MRPPAAVACADIHVAVLRPPPIPFPDLKHSFIQHSTFRVSAATVKGIGPRSDPKLATTKGAFFWDYSGIGILGMDGISVLLGAIPFSK